MARIRWFGQSAFLVTDADGRRVAVDPFAPVDDARLEQARQRFPDFRFAHPPIRDVEAELLLITHEHFDHNNAEAIGGSPHVVRSTAGRFDTPLGEVVAVASEHDAAAGTDRGPNAIVVFTLDGLRFCHFGDFGQTELRAAQRDAIGEVDVLLLPVGGGPTIGGEDSAAIVQSLRPRLVVPMHYGNEAVSFLGPPEPFLDALRDARVERLAQSEHDVEPLLGERDAPTVALFAPPL